ncbi:DNA-3-methyladenine glycosylase I [Nonomuraea sp. NPDC001684]
MGRRAPTELWVELPEPQTVSTSSASIALSKDLRKQGWQFVGPTTVHAFPQAMGLINDHVKECVIRSEAQAAREAFARPGHLTRSVAGTTVPLTRHKAVQ